MTNPLFSIIVPIYNAEHCLKRCIDSILSQNFSGFELLLVDDGSTDNSGVICDSYAMVDSRITVFHKKNGGVSSARNTGLDNARGEWITFADSDDEYTSDAFEKIVETISFSTGSQLIIENAILVPTDGAGYCVYDCSINNLSDVYSAHWKGAVWNCFFKSDILAIHGIRFDETLNFSEDHLFFATYISFIESIAYIPMPCYIQYLPQSYKDKYSENLDFDHSLSFYNKIRYVNRRYSTDYVDGLTMTLIKHMSQIGRSNCRDVVIGFKKSVGADIAYAKGLRKVPIRWLSRTDNTLAWVLVLRIYSIVRNYI